MRKVLFLLIALLLLTAYAFQASSHQLKTGDHLILGKWVNLMPELNPSNPIKAIKRIKRLEAGTEITILGADTKRGIAWYYVSAGPHLGWVNSIALVRQTPPSYQNKKAIKTVVLKKGGYLSAFPDKWYKSIFDIKKDTKASLLQIREFDVAAPKPLLRYQVRLKSGGREIVGWVHEHDLEK